MMCGLGSVVRIATGCGLDGLGIESWWEAGFSAPVQTGPGAHPASCTMGTGSFPGVKSARGVTLIPHPLLVLWSWKSRAIPVLPFGPYSLYRASVPVQGCTLPLPFYIMMFELYCSYFVNMSVETYSGPVILKHIKCQCIVICLFCCGILVFSSTCKHLFIMSLI